MAALEIIENNFSAVTDVEAVALRAAWGRVLAADVIAPIAVPQWIIPPSTVAKGC